ncbi:unnamed protein product [Caenorhabditis bovis]|uniref:CX domain-containing protein n=1 Tax=Caenorhabditis bovis TaxID=2654633 RepID=A0A8S1EP69_9PELO|nr:unnamed protein product [Caenorhabditis bovis]
MKRHISAYFLLFLIFCSLIPPIDTRRGGGGGFGRSGGGRSGGGFSRGQSGARGNSGGGGLFGGSKTRNDYARGSNIGNRGSYPKQPTSNNYGGGYNPGMSSGGGYRGNSNSGSKGGFLGGIFGRKTHSNSGFGSRSSIPRYTSSGIGSRSRSSQFKNMIVGAAAGYLTYQAGKAIIRAATTPMMWNNRPYYWGSNYYRSSPGHQKMCSMPLEPNDPQFGNIYFQDQTRPREITWGCGYYEYCCGYECCRGGDAGHIGGRGSSIGYALVALFLARRLFV